MELAKNDKLQSVVLGEMLTADDLMKSPIKAVALNGGVVTGVTVSKSNIDRPNKVIQFDITNPSGNGVQKLRIGSILGLANTFTFWGQSASACDNANITDQNGASVKAVQGFSEYTKQNAVFIKNIKIETDSVTAQLRQNFLYRELQPDGSVVDVKSNVAYTVQKSDYKDTLVELDRGFLIDSTHFLEYNVLDLNPSANAVTLMFELVAVANINMFAKM